MSASAGSTAEPGTGSAAKAGGALVFLGFMGAGKSRAARAVATALESRAVDSDDLLEQQLGHSIAEEFAQHGERAFREREEEVVCSLLRGAGPRDIISLGGGAVLSPAVREELRRHTAVLVDVELDRAWERASGSGRPLARDPEAFAHSYQERRPLYDAVADAFLPAGDTGVVLRALPALRRLAGQPSGTRLVWATSASGEYPVLLGAGLLGSGAWPTEGQVRRFSLTDEAVGRLYLSQLARSECVITVAPGEESKTLRSAELVWRTLARAGMTRADELVALGGGVIGDLGGFCAATYQRGVATVLVPTTLVSQVDAAYGGKTGVDLPEAKNYVGAYHQPAGVLVDVDTLATLPPAELAAGWAEVIKTALIAGGGLWRRVEAGAELDAGLILDCVRTKVAVVAADERDGGRRQVLNLGHTIGHAIEVVTGYRRYRHGEAVALGLLAALRLSGLDELRERVAALLAARGLPLTLSADPDEVVAATARDKKRLGAQVPFVLLDAPGAPRPGCLLPADEVRAAVAELASEG
ncbi:MAG TPA: bifunctional shikimate kinase/3-dehydroquinate synthase [Solirubrobacteraceae bacterium]|nr:bifunctional shikimate kinase/3-dehydroquinate synthase [Solirubrobacteraceae bacterium]